MDGDIRLEVVVCDTRRSGHPTVSPV